MPRPGTSSRGRQARGSQPQAAILPKWVQGMRSFRTTRFPPYFLARRLSKISATHGSSRATSSGDLPLGNRSKSRVGTRADRIGLRPPVTPLKDWHRAWARSYEETIGFCPSSARSSAPQQLCPSGLADVDDPRACLTCRLQLVVGKRSVIVVPCPMRDVRLTVPPRAFTRCFTMARPRRP